MPGLKTRLLIVDDDPEVVASFCQILEQSGYLSVGAVSGDEAERLIDEFFFDLVILDHFMPGISGLDLLERCRRRYPDIGAIFISGSRSADLQQQAIEAGAIQFLNKGVITP